MYCYTIACNLQCVLRELIMWTDISSEHPIFIKTVAKLTKKDLPKNIVEELKKLNEMFEELNKHAKEQLAGMQHMMMHPALWVHMNQIKTLLNEFGRRNRIFMNLLKEMMHYGKEDKVWQTLLSHIEEEQTYMDRLFHTLYMQL
ncbi:DUF2935 domain-containing protein [Thermotalea metallivorans]|uniref:Hemerythrin-like domain-containing protein n=1 Tax=Thermotalea metallivorans TaxID=520762 RepID=A0A140L0V5_9FIRM|nr:DUF2935 domain-containing protein [Thermotalea metallivorans]KXG74180.1 hypothetical protein AN619_24980 [Thermotalea metallivorans]